jgi:Family of unknown function (DUF6510)
MTSEGVATLDGIAIAGLLVDVFGDEMTTAIGTCAACGASGEIATFAVFTRAPGTVARCRACASVLMVLVTIREVNCVDLRGLVSLERPG